MPSRAKEFFETIRQAPDPAEFLKNLVTTHQQESEFLEFKGADKISVPQTKQHWSQMLSAFANTEGGVLIWGIRAVRTNDQSTKFDGATELALASNPANFCQTLKDVRLQATNPPVQGVEFATYHAEPNHLPGFVVCLVPEGSHKPYRAELDEHQQYYQRTGDNSIVIPHSLLRSLFYPRASADLELLVTLQECQQTGSKDRLLEDLEARYSFETRLCNHGEASGREVVLSVRTNYTATWVSPLPFDVIGRDSEGKTTATANRSIHPHENMIPCCRCSIVAPAHLGRQMERVGGVEEPDKIVFNISLYAIDCEPVHSKIVFDITDVRERRTKSTRTTGF